MGARSDRSWAQDTPTARRFSTLSARYSQPETVKNLWKTRRMLLTKLGMLCELAVGPPRRRTPSYPGRRKGTTFSAARLSARWAARARRTFPRDALLSRWA